MYVLACICACISCSNESIIEKADFTLNAIYNDVEYTVPCRYEGDSIIFLDKNFSNLYNNEISKIPDLVTLSHENGVIEFCKNENELLSKYNLKYLSDSHTKQLGKELMARSITKGINVDNYSTAGTLTLWDDKKKGDRDISFKINYITMTNIPKLKDYQGFNDKTSSLQIENRMPGGMSVSTPFSKYPNTSDLRVVFIGYEDSDYKKAALYCITKCGETHYDSDLKGIPLGGRNWNDKISSIAFRIATANLFSGHDGKK